MAWRGAAVPTLVAITAGACLAAPANAAQRPDLVVRSLAGVPASAAPGASIVVRGRTLNAGSGGARGTLTRAFLSRDDRLDGRDVRLGAGRRVGRLAPRSAARLVLTLRLPVSAASGTYRVLVCADAGRILRERREGNNCAVSGLLRVASPTGGSTPASPSPRPGPTGTGPGTSPIDVPDPLFLDTDGDGIDGSAAQAVFVRAGGSGAADCGTAAQPCATPQAGVDRAAVLGRRQVLVAGGAYPAALLVLADGVSVYGGFGQNFQRDPARATGARDVVLAGVAYAQVLNGAPPQAATVLAKALTTQTVLADVTVDGPDAVAPGRSSHAIVAVDVPAGVLTVTRSIIRAGRGADGDAGDPGVSAATVDAPAPPIGLDGGPGAEFSTVCNVTDRGAGGVAGTNIAPDRAGGAGGPGGTMDTSCGALGNCAVSGNCNATAGLDGTSAAIFVIDGYGHLGHGGTSCSTATERDGRDGRVVNGGGGSGAAGGGLLDGGFWHGRPGTAGGIGADGTGGGGGGGAAGCDDGIDAYGAGGGGGGAGGAAALAPGGGGSGAGGSFGIYLVNASPLISETQIQRGDGGDGGPGGHGGRGQDGGIGGAPGAAVSAGEAGHGGHGAHGGHGGGGGGGGGGISAAIFATSTASAPAASALTITGGTGGDGGTGGISAPGSPPAVDDGIDGSAGAAGTVGSVVTCGVSSC